MNNDKNTPANEDLQGKKPEQEPKKGGINEPVDGPLDSFSESGAMQSWGSEKSDSQAGGSENAGG